jgi:hypothetical protein
VDAVGASEVVELIQNVLAGFEADLKRGSLVTVRRTRSRVTGCRLAVPIEAAFEGVGE